jgi:hypothetical protein
VSFKFGGRVSPKIDFVKFVEMDKQFSFFVVFVFARDNKLISNLVCISRNVQIHIRWVTLHGIFERHFRLTSSFFTRNPLFFLSRTLVETYFGRVYSRSSVSLWLTIKTWLNKVR